MRRRASVVNVLDNDGQSDRNGNENCGEEDVKQANYNTVAFCV